MKQNKSITKTHFEELMEKDRWHGANDLGLRLNEDTSDYWLPFNRIKSSWLREGAKQFIYQQALTKTFSTCCIYLKAFISFGVFITNVDSSIKPNDITRKIIVDYIHELCSIRRLKPPTVECLLSGIKFFFELNVREKWLALPKEPLIFYDDFPRRTKSLPKFIPESVIKQLLEHLPDFSESDRNLITLFLETGRRRGEIFSLPYHCLQQDAEDDYFLKIEDRKMKQFLLIPVSKNCVKHIKQQQAYVDKLTSSRNFLFVIKRKGKFCPMKSGAVIDRINVFANKQNITSSDAPTYAPL